MAQLKVNLLAVVRPELKEQLRKLAEQERRSLSNMAALLLEEGVERHLAEQNQQPNGELSHGKPKHKRKKIETK